MKKLLLSLWVTLLVAQNSFAQLSGTKTINPSGSGTNNYTSFTAAINALKVAGVNGAVTFNVSPAVYQERFTIDATVTVGASATNKIIFQKNPSLSGNVIVRPNTSGTSVVNVYNASYVTLDGINLEDGGNSSGVGVTARGIQLSGAQYCTFKNFTIRMNSRGQLLNATSRGIASGTTFGSATRPLRYNNFDNLRLVSIGNRAFSLFNDFPGSTTDVSVRDRSNKITNCTIDSVANGAVGTSNTVALFLEQDSLVFTGNKILNLSHSNTAVTMVALQVSSNPGDAYTRGPIVENNIIGSPINGTGLSNVQADFTGVSFSRTTGASFKNNVINNVQATSITGATCLVNAGLVFDKNTITNIFGLSGAARAIISGSDSANTQYTGNRISNVASLATVASAVVGIDVQNSINTWVTGNNIDYITAAVNTFNLVPAGIRSSAALAKSGRPTGGVVYITNNFVSRVYQATASYDPAQGTIAAYGITSANFTDGSGNISSGGAQHIYHNTIVMNRIDGTSVSHATACLYLFGNNAATDVIFAHNNVLVNENTHVGTADISLLSAFLGNATVSFSGNNYTGYNGVNVYAAADLNLDYPYLKNWISAGIETNTDSAAVSFVNAAASNYHLSTANYSNTRLRKPRLALVGTDIDGTTRASINTQVGADAQSNEQNLSATPNLYRTIASIRGVNATTGVADSLGKRIIVTGTVHSPNFRPAGLEFAIADYTGGLHMFKSTNVTPAYTITEGDSILVRGTLAQFNGLLQLTVDSISVKATGRPLQAAQIVTALNETTEGRLVKIQNLTIVTWPTATGTGVTATATNGTTTFDIRIDADVNIFGTAAPIGTFSVTGISGQFDASNPFTSGYQLLPRRLTDIETAPVAGTVFAYVANISSNNVSVINTSTNTVTATIPVGSGPGGIAVSPDASRVYTTNQGGGNVSVINTATNSVIATVATGSTPSSAVVSPDGSRVYVANNGAGSVSVINAATNTLITSIGVGNNPVAVAVNADGGRVYATVNGDNKVAVINTATNTLLTTITTSANPYGIASNYAGTRVYTANYGASNVSVINTFTNAVIATVNTGLNPIAVAVSPDGSWVYVANIGSSSVTIINTGTNTVQQTVMLPTGAAPGGISVSPDGTKVYVSNAGSNNVSVINTATNTVMATVTVGSGPYSLGNMMPLTYSVICNTVTLSPTSLSNGSVGTAYNQTITQTGLTTPTFAVTSGSLPTGLTLLGSTGVLSGTPTTTGTYNFTVTATQGTCAGNRAYSITIGAASATVFAYVPNYATNNVSVINTATSLVSTTIAVGANPYGVAVSPNGTKAYVTNGGSNSVSVINTATNTVTNTITVGTDPSGIAVSPDGSKVYVAHYGGNTVSAINALTNTVTATITIGVNLEGVAFSPDGTKVYVANSAAGNVSVINTSTNVVTNTITTGAGAIGIAFTPDGSKMYVSNANANTVSVVNPATNTVTATINVGTLPVGVAVSPDGTKLYVANTTGNTVSVINTATNAVITTSAVGAAPYGLTATPDGSRVYISNLNANNVSIMNTTTYNASTVVIVGSNPYALGNMMPLTYNAVCGTVTLSPNSLSNGTAGTFLDQTISQTGLTTPTFSITAGALPAGLSLSSTGTITGTPTVTGTFNFTVTATQGTCSGNKAYSLVINCPVIATPSISGNATFCAGGSTSLSVSNPVANTTYLWSNGVTSSTIDVSAAGSFSVRAISAGCTSAVSNVIAVTVTPLPSNPTISGNASFCTGGTTTLSVAIPAANTTYLWNNGTVANSITVLDAGSFSVRAISNGCTSAVSNVIDVVVTPLPNTPFVTGNASFCEGGSTTLSVSPVANTTYLWNNGTTGNNLTVNSIGVYSVRAISAGCTSAVSNAVTVSSIPLPTAPSITGNTSFCIGSSNALSVSSPAANTTYLWNNGSTGNSISVTAGGSYSVRAISNGCTSLVSTPIAVTVNALPTTPIITGNNLFCAGGSSTLSISNIAANTTYLWSNGTTANSISVTAAGSYSVRAISNGCTSAVSNVIDVVVTPLPNTPFVTGNASFCEGGSTTLSVSPVANTTYLWNNGTTGNSLTVNSIGVYSVRAISAGCTSAVSNAVTVSSIPLPATPSIAGNTSFCIGSSNTLSVSSPAANTTYLWNNGSTGNNISVTAAGSYSVRAISNGCTSLVSTAIVVTVTALPTTPIVTGNNLFCDGGNATLSISNTAANTTYLWSNGTTANSISVTAAGSYSVRAISNGCTSAVSNAIAVTVTPLPTTPSITGNTSFCEGGSTTLNVTPAANTTYLWNNGATGNSITVNSIGAYTVRAISNGCTSLVSSSVSITTIPLPTAPSIGGNAFFCAGGGTTLSIANPAANTTYLWNNGSTDNSITVTAAGSYTVRAISGACTSLVSQAVSVTVTPLPSTPSISVTGNNTCAVSLTANGGATYIWYLANVVQSATTATFTPSVSGAYTVSAVSAAGCTSAISQPTTVTVVSLLAAPVAAATGATTFCEGGNVVLNATGAPAGAIYTWSNGTSGASITVSTAGTYTVTYANAGCNSFASNTIEVTVNPTPATPSVNGNTSFCAGGNTTLSVASPVANTTYLWSNGTTANSITVSAAGNFTVQAISNGCTSAISQAVAVIVNPIPAAPNVLGATSFCEGGNTTLSVENPVANVTYLWSNGSTNASITTNAAGSFSVQAISNGCTSAVSNIVAVTVTPLPTTSNITVTGNNTCNVVLSANAGATSYIWFLDGSAQSGSSATFVAAQSGIYTYQAIANACTSAVSQSVTVTVVNTLAAPTAAALGNTTFCEGGNVTLEATGAPAGAVYTWSNGTSGASITVATSGIYTVTYNSAGCNSLTSNAIAVTMNPLPMAMISQNGNVLSVMEIPNVTYQWLIGGQSITNATGVNYTALVDGNYSVRVTLNGCETVSNIINVVVISVANRIDASVKVYPNPSAGAFTLSVDGLNNVSIRVTDVLGRIVHTENIVNKLTPLELPKGVYFLQVSSREGVAIKQVVVQ